MLTRTCLFIFCSQCDTDSPKSVGSVQTEGVCCTTSSSADCKLLEKWVSFNSNYFTATTVTL